jgi:SPOR domain
MNDLPAASRAPSTAPRIIPGASRAATPKLISLPQPDDAAALPGQPAQPAQVAMAPVAGPVAAPSPVQRGVPMPAGDRVWVQLGLDANRPQIERLWTRITQQSRGGLDGVVPYVQPVLFNNKPVLRLVVGGYADPSTAQALLARLKQAGLSGLVQRSNQAADPLFP